MEKDPNSLGCDGGMSSSFPMPTAPPSYNETMAGAGPSVPESYPSLDHASYATSGTGRPMPENYDHSKPEIPIQMPNLGAPVMSQQCPQPYVVPPAQVTVIQSNFACAVGPSSVRTKCPTCRVFIQTSTKSSCQGSAHICCLLLFIFGCCLCSCIPYCMNSYKTVQHTCPNCKTFIGVWKG